MPKKIVGLVGCGTIGTHLALAIDSRSIANASLVGLFDVVDNNAKKLKSKLMSSPEVHSDVESLIDSPVDIIIEAASQEAVRKFGKPIINAGKDLMIMSVGALADTSFLAELLDQPAIRQDRSKIYVPTGAIAGIDAIRSVKHLLDSITLTTTKSPKALAGAPFFATRDIDLDVITKLTEIYEGPAAEAVKLFPVNVNVAAVLSLAGLGADKTKVRVLVDPHATTNQHEIVATGGFGDIKITVNNVTAPGNPKTSFLAVLSAIECLRSICDDALRIGS
ncbi:MAG: aspartate dehydrogenase [Thermoproteota archaeon]|jgi:aspartate dehydrogenase|nr:aspartate dehydrogenase [Thermoproteota archaeon]MDQ3727588.1 aspartate dehydrogenase [Thermoproteota archaeon]MDQ5859481.1 aspartate dehydrogenase [Thermoproteota archaeon]